jgi:dienelactone hydrolase
MHHVDHAVPPTLVLSGTADPEVPVATVQAFCEAVRAKGGRCDLALYEGAAHGFFNPGAADRHFFKATNERVESFLASLPR